MRRILSLMVMFVATVAMGQTLDRPQPYVLVGPAFLGSGYQPLGVNATAGVFFDSKRIMLDPEVSYTTGGKEQENPNSSTTKGHTRGAVSDMLFKTGNYYVGPGAEWSRLDTPYFAKSAVHPRFTVGRDFDSVDRYVDRVLVSYVQAGTDKANGVQGFETEAYWFFGKHAMLRALLGGYWAHGTVIPVADGGSTQSVALEESQHTSTGQFQMAFGWRF